MWHNPAAKQKFEAMYHKAVTMSADASLVSLLFGMISLLIGADLAYEAQIQPKNIGIHPKNRACKRMQGSTMHKKGHKIHNVGFNFNLCGKDKAIAFEDNPMTHHCEKHTIDITNKSELFATYKAGTVRAGSVGCSHLNQWLAAVFDGAVTPYTAKLCDPGSNRISTRKVTEANQQLSDGVNKGLTWTVVKHQVETAYPELPTIFQRALNIEHHVGEGLPFCKKHCI